jgi:hypothetical protein
MIIKCFSFSRIHNHTTSSSHNSSEFPITVLSKDKTTDQNEYEEMDTDHDNGVETYEDDDINAVSLNSSSTTAVTGVTSDRQPLSKFKLFMK